MIGQIKKDQTVIRCLVLTQTIRQQDQALSSDADIVFPRNGSVAALCRALEELCAP